MSEENLGKKRFETKVVMGKNGMLERQIFIGGELLDWGVDLSSFMEAKKMGPQYMKAIQMDIAKHFAASVSEVLGRHVSMEEISEATKTGWI